MVRKIRLGEDDGAFDREHWAGFTPEQKLEAVWQMTLDYLELKGLDASESRLDRTVCRLERRGS